jgi:hypothetical protein
VALSRATAKQHVNVLTYPTDHYTQVKGAKLKAVRVSKRKKGPGRAKSKRLLKKVMEAHILKTLSTKKFLHNKV